MGEIASPPNRSVLFLMLDVKVSGLEGQTVISPGDGVLACELGGGAALLHTGSGTYYALNSVGAAIWSLIERSATIASLRKHIVNSFEVDETTARQDLDRLIASLAENELVRIERS